MTRMLCSLVLTVILCSLVIAEETKVPLQTECPKEVLAGTPPEVLAKLYPHLPPPLTKQPTFMVPRGTVNLALKKKVSSSDSWPLLGELSYVTDGKKTGIEGSFVELGPMKQWVQIDLKRTCRVHAVYLWHYFQEARSYHDVVVQVADDAKFLKDVRTVFNNDQDNSLKFGVGRDRPYIETHLGQLIDAKGIKGRYLRLYSRGNTANDANHYVEVEVFGIAGS